MGFSKSIHPRGVNRKQGTVCMYSMYIYIQYTVYYMYIQYISQYTVCMNIQYILYTQPYIQYTVCMVSKWANCELVKKRAPMWNATLLYIIWILTTIRLRFTLGHVSPLFRNGWFSTLGLQTDTVSNSRYNIHTVCLYI